MLTTLSDVWMNSKPLRSCKRALPYRGMVDDGEFKVCDNADYVREPANPALARNYGTFCACPTRRARRHPWRRTATVPNGQIGKGEQPSFLPVSVARHDVLWQSFISRPVSAPWIATVDYAAIRRTVCGAGKKWPWCANRRTRSFLSSVATARTLRYIPCVSHGASHHLDEYLREVLQLQPGSGHTLAWRLGNLLAHRLTQQGLQALDLGSYWRIPRPHAAPEGKTIMTCRRTIRMLLSERHRRAI